MKLDLVKADPQEYRDFSEKLDRKLKSLGDQDLVALVNHMLRFRQEEWKRLKLDQSHRDLLEISMSVMLTVLASELSSRGVDYAWLEEVTS